MLFSSPIFLFLFLPLTLVVYYLSPNKIKNLVLLIASLFFYTWGEKTLVILIILSGLIDFICGLIIEKYHKKIGLIISLSFNIGLLLYFKYAGFLSESLSEAFQFTAPNLFTNIILPLGISFYTFQTMSYSIDVYRGKIKATTNLINFLTYVSLFPQLIAGPIVRYSDIEKEIKERKVSVNLFYQGVQRFVIGLAKKLIVANNCAFLADGIFAMHNDEKSMLIAWLGLIAYGFQIFFDFSGYSDMAIGLGKMFGFNFPENFNFPFISKSIQEFWRRWHISLSTWFKDYLYISLGGNRITVSRTYTNLSIVFFITGLWHGANWTFICWGLFHGLFILVEKWFLLDLLERENRLLSHLYLFLIVTISWAIFRSDTILDAGYYLKQLLDFNTTTNFNYLNFYLTNEVKIAFVLAIIFSTPFFTLRLKNTLATFKYYNVLQPVGVIGLFLICYFYIAADSYNPFIYFRF